MEFTLKNSSELIDILAKKVKKDAVEIELNTNPDGLNIIVRPWKPLQYICPYQVNCNNGENK